MGPHPMLERARTLRRTLVKLRRELHRHPELGFEEMSTATLIESILPELVPGVGLRRIAKTGVLATLQGPREAGHPVVLLRACLDGLPIQDRKDVDYASEVAGVCHACGHDGQIAVLVGALGLLAESAPDMQIHGLFQPAEEIDTGATAVLDDGLLEDVRPDVVLGFHGHPGLDAGTIGVKAGPVMGSITTVRCDVEGREGHGAEPHLASDAVTAVASLVLDWQVALSRRVDPRQPVVLSIGRLSSGFTPNVIPGRAEAEGTLRSLDPALEDDLRRILEDVARGVEARTGTSVAVAANLVVPAVVNDPAIASLVGRATVETLGETALVDAAATLGGDDFAWFLQHVPGCYFFIGERQQGRDPYGWHDPTYDLDEDALVYGAAVLAASAVLAGEAGPGQGSFETRTSVAGEGGSR